jgi:hypothetical protein
MIKEGLLFWGGRDFRNGLGIGAGLEFTDLSVHKYPDEQHEGVN